MSAVTGVFFLIIGTLMIACRRQLSRQAYEGRLILFGRDPSLAEYERSALVVGVLAILVGAISLALGWG